MAKERVTAVLMRRWPIVIGRIRSPIARMIEGRGGKPYEGGDAGRSSDPRAC